MSKQATRPRHQQDRARTKYKGGKTVRSSKSGLGFWIIATVIVVIGIALVVALAGGRSSGGGEQPASAALVKKVTSIPSDVFTTVGTGAATGAPKTITPAAPALTVDGKPEVLYMGAEYCPYCATERWAMVVALSRFGTFSGLKTTHSSTLDVFPNTQTFSFHGASYTSRWLAFTGVEMQGDSQSTTLDVPTSAQQRILDTYDRAPYVGSDSSSSGGIPFIDFGGKYVVGGATYDPSVLQGKSHDSIADALSDPTSAIAKGAIGAANTLTAAICGITNNQPATVCSSPTITSIQSSL